MIKALKAGLLCVCALLGSEASATISIYTDEASFGAEFHATTHTFGTVSPRYSFKGWAPPVAVDGVHFSAATGQALFIFAPGATGPYMWNGNTAYADAAVSAKTVDFGVPSTLDISLSIDTTAFGLSLATYGATGDLDIMVNGRSAYRGSLSNSLRFFGVASNDPIKSLTISNLGTGTVDTTRFLVGSSIAASAVPEPASWAMMIAGVGIAGGAIRRKRDTATSVRLA